jgi:hypothetical protein
MLQIGVKGMGYRRRSCLIETLWEFLGSLKVTFSSYVPLSSSKKVCCPGVGDLMFLQAVQAPYCDILDISLCSALI